MYKVNVSEGSGIWLGPKDLVLSVKWSRNFFQLRLHGAAVAPATAPPPDSFIIYLENCLF
jgi:hypothetical protein